MTRAELHALITTAIANPGQYAPTRLNETADEWAARAVLVALRSPDDEPHLITVWEDGDTWSLSHPLQCRFDDNATCPVYLAARWLDGPPAEPGQYVVTVTDDELVIGEAVK